MNDGTVEGDDAWRARTQLWLTICVELRILPTLPMYPYSTHLFQFDILEALPGNQKPPDDHSRDIGPCAVLFIAVQPKDPTTSPSIFIAKDSLAIRALYQN